MYPVSFAHLVLGPLEDLAVRGDLSDLGVDTTMQVLVRGARGGRARLGATLLARGHNAAEIIGTAGRVLIEETFFTPTVMHVQLEDGRSATFDGRTGIGRDGFAFQIAETARRITAGEQQSPLMPWEDTLSVMDTMDEIRARLGVVYPGEIA